MNEGQQQNGNHPASNGQQQQQPRPAGPASEGGANAPGLTDAAVEQLTAAQIKRRDMFNQRKQREFIPDNRKDEGYWDRRRRNNEAAKRYFTHFDLFSKEKEKKNPMKFSNHKMAVREIELLNFKCSIYESRSREKRRFNDMILEQKVVELTRELHVLKAQLAVVKEKYGISVERLVDPQAVLSSLPTPDQVLAMTKRTTKVIASSGSQRNGSSGEFSQDRMDFFGEDKLMVFNEFGRWNI